MFLDEATIEVCGGQGGRGCISWRREKYIPHGGPNGGDGGQGGGVLLLADGNTDTLSDYASRKRFEAERGEHGMGKNCHGRNGEDLILRVPPGTVVSEVPLGANGGSPTPLGDLAQDGDRLLVASGGRGGFGNAHFKSSVRQRPDFAELGEPGERRTLKLELKLVADVCIIGYPSVGKSTLISVISAARPKIANYPFTTLVPNLGVATVSGRDIVVCDVPGLIEGASEGKGLGGAFLKHIERCGVLLHLLDVSRACPPEALSIDALDPQKLQADYHSIRRELSLYSPALAAKRELVVLNKADLLGRDLSGIETMLRELAVPVSLSISSATHWNIPELLHLLLPVVLEEREKRVQQEGAEKEDQDVLPVLRPHETSMAMGAYRIDQTEDGVHVTGRRLEQFTVMTDFQNPGARRRFLDVLGRIGLVRGIARLSLPKGTPVYIGGVRVDSYF